MHMHKEAVLKSTYFNIRIPKSCIIVRKYEEHDSGILI